MDAQAEPETVRTVRTVRRTTFQYKLQPTPEHERVLEQTLRRCRWRYNCALEQRRAW